MDIEKLIEQLNDWNEKYISNLCGDRTIKCEEYCIKDDCLIVKAATALSALQAENEKLREKIEDAHLEGYVKGLGEMSEENEKLRAELEQVKAERDAAVSWAQKYTESIDMPCVACKHNTGDYVCTAICGNCGQMGAESCKWEFDFSGELKED